MLSSSQSSPTPQPGTSYGCTCTEIECRSVSASGIFRPPTAVNEPAREYAPGSPERESLRVRLEQMKGERLEIPLVIGDEEVKTGKTREAAMPHAKDHVLADVHQGGAAEVERAVDAAGEAWQDWHRL